MEELRCAAMVSCLEGMRGVFLGMCDPAKSTTLPAIETRVRSLETNFEITSPPPVTEISWKGVVWRIWRLRSRIRRTNVGNVNTDFLSGARDFESMIPNTSAITLGDLKNAIASIKTFSPYPKWPELESDDVKLSVGLQMICHMIGQKNTNYFQELPVTLAEIYVVAVRLSIQSENYAIGNAIPLRMPVVPPPGWLPPKQAKKLCCGGCSCSCHNNTTTKPTVLVPPRRPGRRPLSRSSSITSSVTDSGKRKGRFGWLNKLCFWRKKPVKDDVSIMSSGSSTIVD